MKILKLLLIMLFLFPLFSVSKVIKLNPNQKTYFTIDTSDICIKNLQIDEKVNYNIYYVPNKITIEFEPSFYDTVKISYDTIDCSKPFVVDYYNTNCKLDLRNFEFYCLEQVPKYRKYIIFKNFDMEPDYVEFNGKKFNYSDYLVLTDDVVSEYPEFIKVVYNIPKLKKELEVTLNNVKLLDIYSYDQTESSIDQSFAEFIFGSPKKVYISYDKIIVYYTDKDFVKKLEFSSALKKIVFIFIGIIIIIFLIKLIIRK
jgi:hypothetical protein